MPHNAFGGSEAQRYFASTGSGTVEDPIVPVVGVNSAAGNQATFTDRSWTITTGGVAQQLMASNASRTGFYVQNTSDDDLWISDVGTASAGGASILIPSGMIYESMAHAVPTTAISIYGATTGQSFAAREF